MKSVNGKYIVTGIILVTFFTAGYLIFSNLDGNAIEISKRNEILPQENTLPTTPQIVDKQAYFAIFTHGAFRVFTASMYHNLSPDIYIESNNPNIIEIKKVGMTWNDFFSTMPFKLTQECLVSGTGQTFCTGSKGTLKMYLNGIQEDDILTKVINHGDRMLVTYGNENSVQIQTQIDRLDSLQ